MSLEMLPILLVSISSGLGMTDDGSDAKYASGVSGVLYGSADDDVDILEMDELDNCLLSLPWPTISSGDPSYCSRGNVAYLL